MKHPVDKKRLQKLERRLGSKLPPAFIATLEQEPISEGNVVVVTEKGMCDVRTTFALDNGDECDQLDAVYDLVGDVVPSGALPFAENWAGDFFCLMLTGPMAGQVVFWDHERESGDDRVEPVTDSVSDFYARLVPDPRD